MKLTFTLAVLFVVFGAAAQPCATPAQQVSDVHLSASPTSVRGWFTATDADSYLVFYDVVPSPVISLVDGTNYTPPTMPPNSSATASFISNGNTTSFVVNNLQPGTPYYFVIVAANKNCTGGTKYVQGWNSFATATTTTATNNYYFGNLHAHSSYSDGNKEDTSRHPDDDYNYAKNSLCMDFLGISEHNHKGAGMHLADWQPGLAQAAAARTPNFLSLYCMEWGVSDDSAGHVVIYGSDKLWGWETNNYDVFTPKRDYMGTPATTGMTGLFKRINDNSALTFGTLAHPSDRQFDSIFYKPYNANADSAIAGVAVESGPAFSTDTSYSDPPSYMYYLSYFVKLLAKGYHVAPTIDHDNHYYTFGRTANSRLAVLAPSLDSLSFLTAMKQRHFYATQDCDTRLDFTVNNEMMGNITSGATPPAIVITVHDPTNPTASALVKLMKGVPGSGVNATEKTRTVGVAGVLTYTDTSLAPDSTAYYYADISIGGKRVISAPIWYTRSNAGLPITLLSFTAKPLANHTVSVGWSTSREVNNKSFVVERSANGRDFAAVHVQAGAGNTTELTNYTWLDAAPNEKLNYYRLKQIDADGRFTYSNIVAANFSSELMNSFAITPNPASIVRLAINSKERQQLKIVVSDVSGKVVTTNMALVEKGSRTLTLPEIAHTGTYFVTVIFKDSKATGKLVKL